MKQTKNRSGVSREKALHFFPFLIPRSTTSALFQSFSECSVYNYGSPASVKAKVKTAILQNPRRK